MCGGVFRSFRALLGAIDFARRPRPSQVMRAGGGVAWAELRDETHAAGERTKAPSTDPPQEAPSTDPPQDRVSLATVVDAALPPAPAALVEAVQQWARARAVSKYECRAREAGRAVADMWFGTL